MKHISKSLLKAQLGTDFQTIGTFNYCNNCMCVCKTTTKAFVHSQFVSNKT